MEFTAGAVFLVSKGEPTTLAAREVLEWNHAGTSPAATRRANAPS